MAKEYKFNEKDVEYYNGEELEVWQSPKYKESKEKAIAMIKDEKYNLNEGDFWILMRTKTSKMIYTGLIISHNGCLKINDSLENKVNPKCFELDKDGYNGSLVYTYIDDDTFEVGEVSKTNCKNEYPYAMAFKRCFDRVVLKKSKLAFSGIYSESEAEEFKEQIDNDTLDLKLHQKLEEQLDKLVKEHNVNYDKMVALYKVDDVHLMDNRQLKNAIDNIDRLAKNEVK